MDSIVKVGVNKYNAAIMFYLELLNALNRVDYAASIKALFSNRTFIVFCALAIYVFCLTNGYADNDSLGLGGFWEKIEGIMSDSFLKKFIFFALIGLGIYRAFAGAGFPQLIIMIIIGFGWLNMSSIINVIAN